MTPEEKLKLDDICRKVIAEKDPKIFDELVKQMNDLLEQKYGRLELASQGPSTPKRD